MKQEIYLPKSNQTIYFDKLKLSSSESTINLDSLVVRQTTGDSIDGSSDIKVNKLRIKGFDFEKAFNDNDLFIRSISVSKPKITYRPSKEVDDTSSSGLYKYFHQLKIDTIDLSQGSIDAETDWRTKASDLSLRLTNYTLNKEDWRQHKLISSVNVQSFAINNIEQQLPDSIHIATIGQVLFNKPSQSLSINKIKVKPIKGRNSYRNLQSRNVNFSTYTTIKSIKAFGFNPEQILLSKPVVIDTVIADGSQTSILQYPQMWIKKNTKSNAPLDLLIKHLYVQNGSLKLQQFQKGKSTSAHFNGINLSLNNAGSESFKSGIPNAIKLSSTDGSLELKGIGHLLTYSNLSTQGGKSFFAQEIKIEPDSLTLPYHHINARLNNVLLKGFAPNNPGKGVVQLDTIAVESGSLDADFTRENFDSDNSLEKLGVSKLSVKNIDLKAEFKKSIIDASRVSISIQSVLLDSLHANQRNHYSFDSLRLSFDNLNLSNKSDTSQVTIGSGKYEDKDSTLVIKNMYYGKVNNPFNVTIKESELKSISRGLLIDENKLRFAKATITEPEIIVNTQKSAGTKNSINLKKPILSGKIKEVSFDSLDIFKGRSRIALGVDRQLAINGIDGVVRGFKADTLTSLENAFDSLNGAFELSHLQLEGSNDTLSVTRIFLDTRAKNLWSDSIYYNNYSPKRSLRLSSPGIAIHEFDIPSLLKNELSIRQLSSRNNLLAIHVSDTTSNSESKKLPNLDLPIGLHIEGISIKNTRITYTTPKQPNHFLDKLHFDVEIDSLSGFKGNTFNLSRLTKDARLRVYNFSTNLPDSLNKVSFDTLLVSNGTSEVRISNLRYTPLFSKKEYGKKAGFQADLKNLLVKQVTFSQINLADLINEKAIECKKISITDGTLDLYKDKQLPYPIDRRIPMLQERIRNTRIPLSIDTIQITNLNIDQTTLQSSGQLEGSISFDNTNGTITNITNDSTKLKKDFMLKAAASTKIMGKGDLRANFAFNMFDPDDQFFFDARLGAMDAQEFNNILEATAFVSVKSGKIKSINLQATANSSYAYGNMQFLYSNLKVETYNKKNLKTKGMGVTLKSFFANTFVVKKNNSKYRLFGRRGSMYYERDPSRISLDYAAKTALSGVVSSIGARNNSKEIKRVQKEEKQKRDTELKNQKDMQKAAKKTAKQSQ